MNNKSAGTKELNIKHLKPFKQWAKEHGCALNDNQEYENYKLSILGETEGAFNNAGGDDGNDIVKVDGHWYFRHTGETKFFDLAEDNTTGKIPGVLCQCGNTLFVLNFGYFTVIARCGNCGEEEVIFEG